MNLGISGRLTKATIQSPLTPLFLLASLIAGLIALAAIPREEEPQISVPMVLQLAGMAETVTVSSQAPLIDTTEQVVKTLIDTKQIESLPLKTRDFLDLAMLAPGVVTDQGSASGGQTDSISFAGMSENYKSVWLEGVDFWKNNPSRVAEVLHEQYNAAGYSNVTREMAESIVKQIKVEPELTPAIADHIKAEAERMKAANLIKQLPDWPKVMRPDLLQKARSA